jgi:rare lipoprotein A (peptidoglycan hydrolase)
MKIFVPLALMFLFIAGCGSSPRFALNNSKKEKKARYEDRETNRNEKKPEIINEDEYSNSTVLETKTGVASYYTGKYDGRKTSSGEIYNKDDFTAAHLKYPYNTIIRVINLMNNKSVIIRINDRKPDFNGRIIDVSYGAAKKLDMLKNGITEVRLEILKWGDK